MADNIEQSLGTPALKREVAAKRYKSELAQLSSLSYTAPVPKEKLYYRTVWISDTHLGMPCTNTEQLLDLLNRVECKYLFLVGDIVDFWAMKKRMHWPEEHNQVLLKILAIAKESKTEVFYVPGNHDEIMRQYNGMNLGNVSMENEFVHVTVDGKKILIQHGDQYDSIVSLSKTLSLVGSLIYVKLLQLNGVINWFRKKLNLDYWSLSRSIKYRFKRAVKYMSDYEKVVVGQVKSRDFDGIVCGHIHHADVRTIDGCLYHNCGDWVESCTMLVERPDGDINLVYWLEERALEFERQGLLVE